MSTETNEPLNPTINAERPRRSGSTCWHVVVALVIVLGVALRLWALGRTMVNADSAVVGLMGHEILHGHFFAFYWGQNYGGLEPYVVAAVFAVFGQSTFTLGITPALLDALCALLLWRIGRRLFSPMIGIGAALVFWIWPEVYVRASTVELGFRFSALACGLGMLLCALRLGDGTDRSTSRTFVEWSLFGLLAGLGFWASPEIAYYLWVALAYVAWQHRKRRVSLRVQHLVGFVVAAVLGAAPWWYDNVTRHFRSFDHLPQPNPPGSPFINHLRVLVVHVLPMSLGLRLRMSGQWLFGPALGVIAYVGIAGGMLLFGFHLVRHRRAMMLVAFLVAFPFIYALSPFTWYWADGRYALYLAPMLVLGVVGATEDAARAIAHRWQPLQRVPRLGVAKALGAGLALTLGATTQLIPYIPSSFPPLGRSGWFTFQTNPSGPEAHLADALEARGIHQAIAGYWLSYPITFASRGGLIATDLYYGRYRPYVEAIEAAPRAAWIFENPIHQRAARTLLNVSVMNPGCAVISDRCLSAPELDRWLTARHVGYSSFQLSYFTVVVPDRHISAVAVLSHYGVRS